MIELIKNKEVGGERPLFGLHDTRLENITITDGESGIKQCQHMEAANCRFYGKYPWWHVDGALIEDCYFAEGSRSAIWYTNDLVMRRCRIDGPKFFREMKNVELEDVEIMDADETFWKVDGLRLKNVKLHGGTYPFMFSKNIYVDHLNLAILFLFGKQHPQVVEKPYFFHHGGPDTDLLFVRNQRADIPADFLAHLQDDPAPTLQNFTRGGQGNAFARALKQSGTIVSFKDPDLLQDSAWRQIQSGSSFGEASGITDSQKCFKLRTIHFITPAFNIS